MASTRGTKTIFWLLVSIMIIMPALMSMVYGEATIEDHDAPTPDRELRSNERVGSKTDHEVIEREEERINPDGFSVSEWKKLREQAEKHQFQV